MKRIILLLPLLLVTISGTLQAQANFDSTVTMGIKQIYNIQFQDAESTFRKLMADYPERPAGRFFLAMIDWWRIMLDIDDESRDDIFFQKLEDVIFQCDEILEDDPNNVDALFFKGGAIGFRGRLRAYRESWIKAADDGREALPIVEHSSKLDPHNVDVQLGFGIYNYYAAVIPEEFPLLKPLMLFFPNGDKAKGIEQLNNTALHGKYAKYEARYFLMTLYFSYENNPYKAAEYSDMLLADFPHNPIFQRWAGRIAAKQGDYNKAFDIFSSVLAKGDSAAAGYDNPKTRREAAYYVGLQYRNLEKLDSAKHYFELSARYSEETDKKEVSGFLINTYLYLGMINDQIGSRDEAVEYYEKLLEIREYGQSHSLARKYLETPYSR